MTVGAGRKYGKTEIRETEMKRGERGDGLYSETGKGSDRGWGRG